MNIIKKFALGCGVLFLLPQPSMAERSRNLWQVDPGQSVRIDISADTIIREKLPEQLFSFNINYRRFQEMFWDQKNNQVYPSVVDAFKNFNGAIFRYPGGKLANNFDWKQALGPLGDRKYQAGPQGGDPEPIIFGIDEYLDFLNQVDGRRWYVLNLGFDHESPFEELNPQIMAQSNRELASYFDSKKSPGNFARYYQLGNELDRSEYEWSTEKYIERSRLAIEAIREVDDSPRFVAFLRDFRWKYKADRSRGFSNQWEFMRQVLNELPMIEDYSFHKYYDGPGKRKQDFWLDRIVKSVEIYKSIRDGRSPRIWITEHAIRRDRNKANKDKRYRHNLNAAIGVADYLIGLAQIPEVRGAVLHAGGPWSLLNISNLKPNPVYWGVRILRDSYLPVVLATKTTSSNVSQYAGGYDVRAVALRDSDGQSLAIWVVNRANNPTKAELSYASFANQTTRVQHTYVAGRAGLKVDNLPLADFHKSPTTDQFELNFSEQGTVSVELPPNSVSSFVIN